MRKKLKNRSKTFLCVVIMLLVITNSVTLFFWLQGISVQELKNYFLQPVGEIVEEEEGNVLKLGDVTPSSLDAYYIDIVNIGDSNLIKLGDYEILIDGGEKRDGTDAVVPFLKEKVTDGIIELTIVTHSDSDHNGGFSGLKDDGEYTGIFYSGFRFAYITDYGYKEKYENTEYEDARDYALNTGNGKYQSINDAFTGNENTYYKVVIGEDFSLEFIDTGYYDIYGANVNDRSIVCIVKYFDYTFFYGGDINDDQEKLLIEKYDLPKINFYKASHHGSITSNCKEFLDVINPDFIFLNCEIENQHNIPNIKSLEVLTKYANDNMYVTGLNGTIDVRITSSDVVVLCANNNTKFIDTEYYDKIMNGEIHK